MIAIIKPTRIELVENRSGKTAAQLKAELGCDYIINGGLFNGLSDPCPLLKIAGEWKTAQPWGAFGMSWNTADDCEMTASTEKANFISCVALINPVQGDKSDIYYTPELGGARPRTAWGITQAGDHLLYVSQSGSTPKDLRTKLAAVTPLKALLMLDGGGSTQGIFPGETVAASRRVANFIAFWTKDKNEGGTTNMSTMKKGSKGPEVKTLQEDLNELIRAGLDTDGDFGSATENAVRIFQAVTGISVDGIAGAQTQARIEQVRGWLNKTETLPDKVISKALSELGTLEPTGDDKYIADYNAASGAGLGLGSSWCMMFVWWCLSFFSLDAPVTASCTTAMRYYQSRDKYHSDMPLPGDVVYFDWDRSGDADHVGIVVEVTDKTITTVEGNTSTAAGDAVAIKTYDRADTRIRGYATVTSEPETAQPEPKWYDEVMAWAKQNGINDGTRPEVPASRAEVAQMLFNYDALYDGRYSGLLTED